MRTLAQIIARQSEVTERLAQIATADDSPEVRSEAEQLHNELAELQPELHVAAAKQEAEARLAGEAEPVSQELRQLYDRPSVSDVIRSAMTTDASATKVASSARTPLYAASNSERYHRQDLIKCIQKESEFRLICYVSDDCRIEHDDELQFRDLLHRIDDGENIELLLHTPGGDIDAADKLIHMVREKTGDAAFRVVVPHLAKSAGTLMVLGADTVVMSDTSELGPIDPQMLIPDSTGMFRWVAAQNYIDAYKTHSEALRRNPADRPSEIMFRKLDPAVYDKCVKAKERSRRLAENLLMRGMFRQGGNWTATADRLIDTRKWQTHSQVISLHDAATIGLRVEGIKPQDEFWQKYWRLYCLQRLAIGANEKLFESDYVSLPTKGRGG